MERLVFLSLLLVSALGERMLFDPEVEQKMRPVDSVRCDTHTVCPDDNTCCPKKGGGYSCCPVSYMFRWLIIGFALGVAVGDDLFFQPEETETEAVEEFYNDGGAHVTMTTVKCLDGKVCPVTATCCPGKKGYKCCPFPNGVCCKDKRHCCRQGYRCNLRKMKCLKNSEDKLRMTWAEPVFDTYTETGEELHDDATKSAGLEAVRCPDGSTCPDGQTCCVAGFRKYNCCPYPNAVCCADKRHCCPSGYKCDTRRLKCIRRHGEELLVTWAGVVSSSHPKLEVDSVKQAVESSQQKAESVICPDLTSCPDGDTCCPRFGGSYNCCPLPNAVCCSDRVHCCPSGSVCDATGLHCLRTADFTWASAALAMKKVANKV